MYAPHELIKAARIALKLDQKSLAAAAGVSTKTLQHIEFGYAVNMATWEKVQTALEAKGIEFLQIDGGARYGFSIPRQAIDKTLKTQR